MKQFHPEINIPELKVKIKKWEAAFARENGKKPDKEDIKKAPDSILDAYQKYWKARKNKVKEEIVPSKDSDVWSVKFNKDNQKESNPYKSADMLHHFSEKLRDNASLSVTQAFFTKRNKPALKEIDKNEHCTGAKLEDLQSHMETTTSTNELCDESYVVCNERKYSCKISQVAKDCNEIFEKEVSIKNIHEQQNSLDDVSLKTPYKYPFQFKRCISEQHTSFHSINLLKSPLSICQRRQSHTNFSIDKKWLERCNTEIESDFCEKEVEGVQEEKEQKCGDQAISNNDIVGAYPNVEENVLSSTTHIVSDVKNTYDEEYHSSSEIIEHCDTQLAEHNLLTKPASSNCERHLELESSHTTERKEVKFPNDEVHGVSENSEVAIQKEKITTNRKGRKRKLSSLPNLHDECRDQENFVQSKKVKQTNKSEVMSNNKLNINENKGKEEKSKVKQFMNVHINREDPLDSCTSGKIRNPSLSSSECKRKFASGLVNDNFVRINLKKKRYVRGHKHFSSQKYKKQKWVWLQKMKNASGTNPVTSTACFKCGQVGHWARRCPTAKGSLLPKLEADDEDEDCSLPTLEEAALLARGVHLSRNMTTVYAKESGVVEQADLSEGSSQQESGSENLVSSLTLNCDKPATNYLSISPLFKLDSNGKSIATPPEIFEAMKKMGYSSFRPGQEKTVMRVLSGLSTLVVLPTGAGKSLCYQLPAYLYAQECGAITLVISPLVALMEDQVSSFPSCMKAVCLHSGLSHTQKQKSVEAVTQGKAHVLLVSPEAIVGDRGFGTGLLPPNFPPIAFVCIDEVHCLSEWSHNFRPSYLQLYKVLTQKYGIHCILGLTATATSSTVQSIVHMLNLQSDSDAVIGKTSVPLSLSLSVSRDKYRDEALINLLCGKKFCNVNSIIVYCTRREETERLAILIRTCMQDKQEISPVDSTSQTSLKNKGQGDKELTWSAEAYHAGLSAFRRRSIQKRFMTGKLRIVVATVAFGMGLDKADVRGIIHYNMPKNFESYVQEIGRAGRDGLIAYCHLFLDSEGGDLPELKRHIYANSADRHVLRKLLKKIFKSCHCQKLHKIEKTVASEMSDTSVDCPGHEVAFPVESTVQELDMKEENISTLLCYLELQPHSQVHILQPVYSMCTIRCYAGAKQLRLAAKKCPPLAVAMVLNKEKNPDIKDKTEVQFPVVEVASLMGWDSGLVKKALKQLEWKNIHENNNSRFVKTGILVEFSDLAFHVHAKGDLTADELDEKLDYLYNRVTTQEARELSKLHKVYNTFKSVSHAQYWACEDEVDEIKRTKLKDLLNEYFEKDDALGEATEVSPDSTGSNLDVDLGALQADIHDLICVHHDNRFTGRAVARIFHGIGSPQFPAEVWGRVHRFWRSHLGIDFNTILNVANEEIVKLR